MVDEVNPVEILGRHIGLGQIQDGSRQVKGGADLIAGCGMAVAVVTIVEELPVADELERGSSLLHAVNTRIARIPKANANILLTMPLQMVRSLEAPLRAAFRQLNKTTHLPFMLV